MYEKELRYYTLPLKWGHVKTNKINNLNENQLRIIVPLTEVCTLTEKHDLFTYLYSVYESLIGCEIYQPH